MSFTVGGRSLLKGWALRILLAVLLVGGLCGPLGAQDLGTGDIERLQLSIADASADLAQAQARDAVVGASMRQELSDLRDEVVYLTVRLRKGQAVARTEYFDLRDRIDTLRTRARAVVPPPPPVSAPAPPAGQSAAASGGSAVAAPDASRATVPPETPRAVVPAMPDEPSPADDRVALSAMMGDPPAPVLPEIVARGENGRVTLRAVRIRDPFHLDGRLEEPFYQTVVPVSDFIQQDPTEGAPATEKTEAWIFFDDKNIYVSARCWDSHPERMIANEMRRDGPVMQNENFAVLLDTFRDHRSGFLFHVNPLGGMFDADIRPTMNRDWNGVWDVKTGRFDGGWTVEIVIPFKSLRYRKDQAPVWGVNLRRIVRWKNELSYLVPVPAAFGLGAIAQPSRTGALVGVEVPGGSRTFEVKPYAISDVTTNRTSKPTIENELGGDFGFDVKVGVTQGLTADVTYNTDFAQVEVDEQQVNLTRFNLFFPEKREFFLEGQGIFDFGGVRSGGGGGGGGGNNSLTPVLFFSRRIGLSQGRAVPIDVGARLTGKPGPLTVGALHIQTADESDGASGMPSTSFDVVRLKRDVLRRSTVGALITRRSASDTGGPASLTYGADAAFSFRDRLTINGSLARTDTPGLDGNDLSYRSQLDYNTDRYGAQLERLVVEANFKPDIGFLPRTDFRRNFGSFRFSPRPKGIKSIRKFYSEGSADYIENGAGQLETRSLEGVFGIDLENSDQFRARFTRNYEYLVDPFEIRTGVTIPTGGYDFDDGQLSYTFGLQRKIAGTFSYGSGRFYDGEKRSITVRGGRIEVTPRFFLEPGASYDKVDLPAGSFTSRLVNMRTSFTATPRMYIGALTQYNATTGSISSNVRLRWEYTPGSEFFVVYTEERDSLVPRFPALKNRAFVVKFNRLLRF